MASSAKALLLLFSAAYCFHSGGAAGDWQSANASYYPAAWSESGIGGGACGYGREEIASTYTTNTAAVSQAMFNNGAACGSCYELKCVAAGSSCLPGTIVITVANLCPPNYAVPEADDWCRPGRTHFDMPETTYNKIAVSSAAIMPVNYRSVPCVRTGGIRFGMNGLLSITQVLVSNVAGAGDVQSVLIKGSSTGSGWQTLTREYGQIWARISELHGQSLSFTLTISDGCTIICNDVVPANWVSGKTFPSGQHCQF